MSISYMFYAILPARNSILWFDCELTRMLNLIKDWLFNILDFINTESIPPKEGE